MSTILITVLSITGKGHSAILICVDRLSKMAHSAATKTEHTFVDCASVIMHHLVRLHGCINDIFSGTDPRFTCKFFAEFCNLAGTKKQIWLAYHPQSHGQTECVNRILEDMLHNNVRPLHSDGDEYLDALKIAHNKSLHQFIQITPVKLICGIQPKSPSMLSSSKTKGICQNDAYLSSPPNFLWHLITIKTAVLLHE